MDEFSDDNAPRLEPDSPPPDLLPPIDLNESEWSGVRAAGLVIVDPDGRIWIRKPRNHFGGYKWTWPKGTLAAGEHPQAAAHRETWEETGLTARIDSMLGDYAGDTSMTRFYLAHRVGGSPSVSDETSMLGLATWDEAASLLHKKRDLDVFAEARARLARG